MITTIISDLGNVLLFSKDKTYTGKLNPLHTHLSQNANYKFLDHFELNTALLTHLKKYKDKLNIYMLTAGTIQNTPEIKQDLEEVFQKVYSSKDLDVSKSDPEVYIRLLDLIGVDSSSTLFIDDMEKNCVAAKTAGLNVINHINNDRTVKRLSQYISF